MFSVSIFMIHVYIYKMNEKKENVESFGKAK